jgi:hypothetical protein
MSQIATDLLPVNVSVAGLMGATDNKGQAPVAPTDPALLSSLTQESYQLSGKLTAKLGFPIASLDTDNDFRVMLFGVMRYVDEIDENQHTYRFGVAIRVLLEIFGASAKADLTLPVIAAHAELGMVSASAQLLIYGYAGDLATSLPNWQSFDVDSYADYLGKVNELQRKILGDTANIRPVLLSSTQASALKDPGDDFSRHGHRTHWRFRFPIARESA